MNLTSPRRFAYLLMIVVAAHFVAARPLTAQSGGPTLALAQGFSVDAATPLPSWTPASLILNETQFDDAKPTPYVPPPGVADFTALPIPATLDVDAISIGLDWVVSDPSGTVAVPPGNWAAISYTTSRATVGSPGSLIASEVARPDGAAGDVFLYVLPGSALPPPIVGIPMRAQDSTEISIWSPAAPGNLDAHDLFIGLIYRDNPRLAVLLPPPTVYFSVTDATKTAIPAAWAAPALRSGATVFSTTWQPATSSWSAPVVAFAPAAFGLSASEDLDALALDLAHGRVLFSTAIGLPPLRNPLLFSVLGTGVNTAYVLPGGGVPVATALGLGSAPDDLDGICALDPGTTALPTQARIDRMVGTWGNPVLPTALTNLHASAWRRFDQVSGQEFLATFMTGWAPPGTPLPGIAAVAVTIGPPAVGPWLTAGIYLRPDPLSPYVLFDGHPERYQFVIPPAWSLSNVPISFLWGAAGSSGFSLSHPVTINL